MNKNILIFGLVISLIANVFFCFFQPVKLYVEKEVKWSFNEIDAHGFLEPINYESSKDWNTVFYIHYFDNSSFGEPSKFYAREVVIAGSSIVNLDLKEYEVVEATESHIVARDDTYTFEVTKEDVFITDKVGQKSKLSNQSIKL